MTYRFKGTLIHSPAPAVSFADQLFAKLALRGQLRVVNIAPLYLLASFALIDEIPWRVIWHI